ncbi:MAG: hypothetical protein GWM90_31900, partial [Gemmatimonadetes bacterium]|nr:hypothetical protein [Gemmatimonadota bacterium]NIU80075.1 hypothetical protein [Gammaproteobacteria bacterium]NIQ59874.1 hypothetical protein [Gemmatimonadota bacterium]NIW37937.1 hypothetical protein [Gemmatimonadota bacterium]NIX48494.1 hypothetical protein [Gemmatimonadota bacterium]
YRRWGVDTDEVPDHFAVEAAFMAGLVAGSRGIDGLERDRAWLREHLRVWAPPFLARVEEADRTGVYAAAARWARSLLAENGRG